MPRLPANRGVHLREQACWNLYVGHPAHPGRRGEARKVSDHAAAEGDHCAGAIMAFFSKPVCDCVPGFNSLLLFAGLQNVLSNFDAVSCQCLAQGRVVKRGHDWVADHHRR